MPIDENAAWQQLRPGHRRADTVSHSGCGGTRSTFNDGRAARNYVSTDLKGVAMKQARFHWWACAAPRRLPLRQGAGLSASSFRCNWVTKRQQTGQCHQDPLYRRRRFRQWTLRGALRCHEMRSRAWCTVGREGAVKIISRP